MSTSFLGMYESENQGSVLQSIEGTFQAKQQS
jgi:hypothetical protein